MNSYEWVQTGEKCWDLVSISGASASPDAGSVQICNETVPETEEERLPETEEEWVPETEFQAAGDERWQETESERVPETEAELVPANALAPPASVAVPITAGEAPYVPLHLRSEEARIEYYKFLSIWCPAALNLI